MFYIPFAPFGFFDSCVGLVDAPSVVIYRLSLRVGEAFVVLFTGSRELSPQKHWRGRESEK